MIKLSTKRQRELCVEFMGKVLVKGRRAEDWRRKNLISVIGERGVESREDLYTPDQNVQQAAELWDRLDANEWIVILKTNHGRCWATASKEHMRGFYTGEGTTWMSALVAAVAEMQKKKGASQ